MSEWRKDATMKIIVLLMLVGITILTFGQNAYGCTCKPEESVGDAWQEAAAVFTGQVTFIEEIYTVVSEDEDTRTFRRDLLVKFEVEAVWKGSPNTEFVVRTSAIGCGYPFTVGEKYLVYGYGKKILETSGCTRTQAFSRATRDLQKLGQLAKRQIVKPNFQTLTTKKL